MNKREQIKRMMEAERTAEDSLRTMLTETLRGPRAKECAAFLRNMMSEAKPDTAIYRIQLGNFSSPQYYSSLCLVLQHVVAHVPDLEMSKDDALQFIWLSFFTKDAIEGFKDGLPLGFHDENDGFEFIERKRSKGKPKWVLVTKPIMWEQVD